MHFAILQFLFNQSGISLELRHPSLANARPSTHQVYDSKGKIVEIAARGQCLQHLA
jgi:hypothetical protein